MAVVTANDLKTRGISDIERVLQEEPEVVITVRGKSRYVVMDIARYDFLRECEIASAWLQAQADVTAGRYRRETADEHRTRIKDDLADAI
jgi:prevent-host-death family protein